MIKNAGDSPLIARFLPKDIKSGDILVRALGDRFKSDPEVVVLRRTWGLDFSGRPTANVLVRETGSGRIVRCYVGTLRRTKRERNGTRPTAYGTRKVSRTYNVDTSNGVNSVNMTWNDLFPFVNH